jgi:hypothetical protein
MKKYGNSQKLISPIRRIELTYSVYFKSGLGKLIFGRFLCKVLKVSVIMNKIFALLRRFVARLSKSCSDSESRFTKYKRFIHTYLKLVGSSNFSSL